MSDEKVISKPAIKVTTTRSAYLTADQVKAAICAYVGTSGTATVRDEYRDAWTTGAFVDWQVDGDA